MKRRKLLASRLLLVASGSIAAIKILPLAEAFRAQGREVDVLATPTPLRWDWVPVPDVEAVIGHPVMTSDQARPIWAAAIQKASTILVAPASADFLSQLAQASTPLGLLLGAHRGPLIVAPAMNVRMWQHPATQRNRAALQRKKVVLVGPAKGLMACGDEGYGRMARVDDLVGVVDAIETGVTHPALALIEKACTEGLAPIPFCPTETTADLLIALTGRAADEAEIEALSVEAAAAGRSALYALDPPFQREQVERCVGAPAIADHFQIPDLEGMEHIKLPERVRAVFLPFPSLALAEALLAGRGGSLCRDMCLASKVPVLFRAGVLPALIEKRLIEDGLRPVTRLDERLSKPSLPSAFCHPT
jgi:hypothetical protein